MHGTFEKELVEIGFGGSEQQHVPVLWLCLAIIPVVGGVAILTMKSAKSRSRSGEGKSPDRSITAS